jgi:hypothetical protein
MALDLTELARNLALTRLRSEHPGWSESECVRELLRYAFQGLPLPPPLRRP